MTISLKELTGGDSKVTQQVKAFCQVFEPVLGTEEGEP